jgi:predicted unusual protein kinase regulating ubiquinone biosynthesis (AarF/ABC1/UbiB family)
MLRTNDGKLCILDFGLMTEITDDQKYGMIEAIAHLINRDYSEIGQDFKNLDFIPPDTDTGPIVVSTRLYGKRQIWTRPRVDSKPCNCTIASL